jgi:hypothetical protein
VVRPGERLQLGHEFVSLYNDEIKAGHRYADKAATVVMLERTYEAQRRVRTHFALGSVALGQQWRYLRHSLAITTVNQPFTMNYRSQATIQPHNKLTVPYDHIHQMDMYVGVEHVRDHLWEMADELLESNRVGIRPFPIFLDHLESMVAEAKEAEWDIV